MTTNLTDRPPKISGLITVKQLIWTVLAGICVIPVFAFLSLGIASKVLIAFMIALPILVVGWFPESQTSPIVFLKALLQKRIINQVRKHNGNSGFYKESAPIERVKRDKELTEIR